MKSKPALISHLNQHRLLLLLITMKKQKRMASLLFSQLVKKVWLVTISSYYSFSIYYMLYAPFKFSTCLLVFNQVPSSSKRIPKHTWCRDSNSTNHSSGLPPLLNSSLWYSSHSLLTCKHWIVPVYRLIFPYLRSTTQLCRKHKPKKPSIQL